jgi:hypothetical protein
MSGRSRRCGAVRCGAVRCGAARGDPPPRPLGGGRLLQRAHLTMAVLPVPGRPCTSTSQAPARLVNTLNSSLICGFLAGHLLSSAPYAACTLPPSLVEGCCAMAALVCYAALIPGGAAARCERAERSGFAMARLVRAQLGCSGGCGERSGSTLLAMASVPWSCGTARSAWRAVAWWAGPGVQNSCQKFLHPAPCTNPEWP